MSEIQDDGQLIEASLEGNDAAFGRLVEKYLRSVYSFLSQFMSDRAVTDDLVQETFIKAWKHLARFDRNKKFKTWLFAIGKHTAYDWLKKKKSLPFSAFENEDGYNVLETLPEEMLLPNELLEQMEDAVLFEHRLAALPDLYRILLLMRYQEGFSLQEIAGILAEPYNTIKSRHQRALYRLKQLFLKVPASD